jgi:ABC-type multidrug transport system ATPase subunit
VKLQAFLTDQLQIDMSLKQSALSRHFASTRASDDSFDLEWKNLNFSILVKDTAKSSFGRPAYKKKDILKDVSGEISSGQLLAIMGPTGCGKTSLLNILAARVPRGGSKNARLSGSIKLNKVKRDENKFRSISAYVLQDDNLYAHLTVLETLQLAATFFLPAETTDAERMALVEAVISELGLSKARDTPIGNDKSRGVSGGERKRVCVAVQLISGIILVILSEGDDASHDCLI